MLAGIMEQLRRRHRPSQLWRNSLGGLGASGGSEAKMFICWAPYLLFFPAVTGDQDTGWPPAVSDIRHGGQCGDPEAAP